MGITKPGIFIRSWYDDPNDTALKDLAKVLKTLVKNHSNDFPTGLKIIKQKMKNKFIQNID